MRRTCSLLARPLPTTAFLICEALYSARSRPAWPLQASNAPRDWPSMRALAMLRPDLTEPGTELEVEIYGERRRAVVQQDRPLWDPENERLKA